VEALEAEVAALKAQVAAALAQQTVMPWSARQRAG
jgi:hypothetical protein